MRIKRLGIDPNGSSGGLALRQIHAQQQICRITGFRRRRDLAISGLAVCSLKPGKAAASLLRRRGQVGVKAQCPDAQCLAARQKRRQECWG
jgi:hypothetical protein